MKEKLIDKNQIKKSIPFFSKKWTGWILDVAFRLLGAHKVNAIYDASKHLEGIDFVNDMLKKLDITCDVKNYKVIDELQGKPFITVSNHPYGHVDGIIAISVVGAKRPDYKMMVNWILDQIDTVNMHFISVNPYAKDSKMADMKSSVGGVKQSLQHLKEGHPLGLFPAGGVSSNYLFKTEDRQWQPTVVRLIKKAKVPIIPMYISGNNSWIYRTLGFINWRLRTFRLLNEVTNKRGKTIHVCLGKPIDVEEQNEYTDIESFAEFLKRKTYEQKQQI